MERAPPVDSALEKRFGASDREPFPALRPSVVEHLSSTKGLHPRAKPVRSGAANLRGLVCAFHCWIL